MMIGLDVFKNHFKDFQNSYTLIGGAACYLLMNDEGLEFRATKDLDLVLCAEAISDEFVQHFWLFVNAGGYTFRKKSTDKVQLYRFEEPTTPGYPYMLELLSRIPDLLDDTPLNDLTPMATDEKLVSLSAIILDDTYYQFILRWHFVMDGVAIADVECLIPLKARAWLNLKDLKNEGEHVNERDIRKHKNDVFVLHELLTSKKLDGIPESISQDMLAFTEAMKTELIDERQLSLTQTRDEIIESLRAIYRC